eukprot:4289076-Lingulodinium_polyedra.AAC.1
MPGGIWTTNTCLHGPNNPWLATPHQCCLGCQCPAALGRESRPNCLVEDSDATQAGVMASGNEEAGIK